MTMKNNPDVLEQIKTITASCGIDGDKAAEIAQKCYDQVMFRPYGGATSFQEVTQLEATRQYTYKIDDATYKLRGIIENISYQDDMNTGDKVSAIKTAADDYGNLINSINVDLTDTGVLETGEEKSIIDWVKELFTNNKDIKKEDGKWVVYSKSGRRMGSYDTKPEAMTRLAQIEAYSQKEIEEIEAWKASYNAQQRRDMAKKGWARPDGSFPIANVQDLKNAIRDFGRGGSNPADKAHIKKRARALGATDQLPESWKSMTSESFKVFKDKQGDYRWLSFSSNAFEDKENELFATKALEEAVDYAEKNDERGPLMIFHIPGSEIGTTDFQAVQGRFLIESGTFDDTPAGKKALEYFLNSKENHQVSIGYKYIDGDEKDGTYDWLRFKERSVCPDGTAANPYTDFQVLGGDKEMDEIHQATLTKILGKELADGVIAAADTKTKELEDQNVRFKATPDESQKEETENFIKQLAKNLGVDEDKVLEEARKIASGTSEEKKEDQKPESTTDESQIGQMLQLVKDMAEKIDTLDSEVKEIKSAEAAKENATPRLDVKSLKASESFDNLLDPEKMKEITGQKEDEPVNPAAVYVQDILNNGRVAASN